MASEAHRLRAENDGPITNHGTAFVLRGMVVTAWHVLQGNNKYRIEVDGKWVRCTLLFKENEVDMAILKPERALDDSHTDKNTTACFGSVESRPVKKYDCLVTGLVRAEIWGFGSGASGSPIYKDGKLAGMAVASLAREDEVVAPTNVVMVPAALIEAVIKEVKK